MDSLGEYVAEYIFFAKNVDTLHIASILRGSGHLEAQFDFRLKIEVLIFVSKENIV